MPLERGNTRQAISHNIRAERAAGKPQKQAVAIALNTARESMKNGKAKGKGPGLTKVGNVHAGFGHVKAIRMGQEYGPDHADDDGMAEITVHHGPKPKAPKRGRDGMIKGDYPPSPKRSTLHIPHAEAKELKIGDRVRVTLHRHS